MADDDDIMEKLVRKTIDAEQAFAHEQTLAKTKRQSRLFDEIDKFLNDNWEQQANDN